MAYTSGDNSVSGTVVIITVISYFSNRGKNEFLVVVMITVISRFSFFPNRGKNEFEKQWLMSIQVLTTFRSTFLSNYTRLSKTWLKRYHVVGYTYVRDKLCDRAFSYVPRV